MALGNLTKQALEQRAVAVAQTIVDAFSDAEELRARVAAEFASGTLDTDEFYPPADPVAQTDKGNLLGALDDLHAINAAMAGAALPTKDYRLYLNHLIGV